MKVMSVLLAVVAIVSGANAADTASSSNAATMAVADPSRPESDTTRDADRKPAQTLAVAGIVTTSAALEGLKVPEKLDLFWISRNYHDLHDKFMGPVNTAAFNEAVYSALKPGGFYVVLDHSAAVGAPANVTETLHRIESSTVRREVEAAGFKFDSESSIFANPTDPRTAQVFDKTIRGKTDQFIHRFRKPRQ